MELIKSLRRQAAQITDRGAARRLHAELKSIAADLERRHSFKKSKGKELALPR